MVKENIETKGKEVFSWLTMNYLKANPDKSQLLLASKGEASIEIDDPDIKSSSSKKLLGVLLNDNSLLTKYLKALQKKQANELHALMLWLGFQNILLKTNLEL